MSKLLIRELLDQYVYRDISQLIINYIIELETYERKEIIHKQISTGIYHMCVVINDYFMDYLNDLIINKRYKCEYNLSKEEYYAIKNDYYEPRNYTSGACIHINTLNGSMTIVNYMNGFRLTHCCTNKYKTHHLKKKSAIDIAKDFGHNHNSIDCDLKMFITLDQL